MDTMGSPDSLSSEPSRPSSTDIPDHRAFHPGQKISGKALCSGCGQTIFDRWMLNAGNQAFHMSCLRCAVCLRTLDSHKSCFIRNGRVFCKNHYLREHGVRCSGCGDGMQPTDWIRRARDLVYHVMCFRCHVCHVQLSTGETFVMRNDVILCTDHCDVILSQEEGDNMSVSSVDSESRGPEMVDDKARRSRASFSKEQLQSLHEAFVQNPVPGAEDIDRLAGRIGFPRKNIMIWFQNARARCRKTTHVPSTGLDPRPQGYFATEQNPSSPGQPIYID